jgi:predicted ATPase
MLFKKIELKEWRQYKDVNIDFHRRLTILTGANGAGKTTILNLLGRHFGWQGTLVSTPRRRRSKTSYEYSTDTWSRLGSAERWVSELASQLPIKSGSIRMQADKPEQEPNPGLEDDVGKIIYDNNIIANLKVPQVVQNTYAVNIQNQQNIEGMHIPSHRPIYSYQPVQNIPTIPRKRDDIFSQYTNIVRQKYLGQHTQWSPNYYIKETLIALAVFGPGNSVVNPHQESMELFERFQEILSIVLPPKLGFEKIVVRIPEVVFITKSGEFSLDAASGGIASIIDIAWQILIFSPKDRAFVVTIDEPENHLHPELQRNFLSGLMKAFPSVQFVVASHNPFIVSSVPDSNVYVLNYDETNKVVSEYLDTINRAGSSNEILRDVLGLEFTMPLWVENRLEEVVNEFENKEISKESLSELRREMTNLGMERYIPDTIAKIVRRASEND